MTTEDSQPDDKTELLAPAGDDATRVKPLAGGDATRLNPRAGAEQATRVAATEAAYTPGATHTRVGIGSTVKQRFVLEQLLGVGGMGAVYRARDLRKEEAGDESSRIALKILSDEFRQHPRAFVTLQREAKKTQALAHPNIVTVYDFDREGDLVYLTMEELRGTSLADIISSEGPPAGKAAVRRRIDLVRQIAAGLAYAHSKGFVHSDLKPNNVMVTEEGVVKILDFGIARAAHEKSADSFDAGELGALTPRYASLEMLKHEAPDPSDDIYALGIILCELLGGEHPYRNRDAAAAKQQRISPALPKTRNPLLGGLLRQAVALERGRRIASADVFLRKLAFAQKGPGRIAIAASLAIAALAGNYAYLQTIEDSGVPFEALPAERQAEFRQLMDQGRTALNLNILQDAVVFFDRAYAIHATNDEIQQAITAIQQDLNRKLENAEDQRQREFYQQQLLHLQEYKAFSH